MTKSKNNMKEIIKNLKNMSVKERKKYLRDSKLSKNQVRDELTNKKIPFISMFLVNLDKMSEEEFHEYIATKIDLIPTSILEKFI